MNRDVALVRWTVAAGFVLFLLLLVAGWAAGKAEVLIAAGALVLLAIAVVAVDWSRLSAKGPGGMELVLEKQTQELEKAVGHVHDLSASGAATSSGYARIDVSSAEPKAEVGTPGVEVDAGQTQEMEWTLPITPYVGPSPEELERQRRDAIEHFMRVAAEWGWLMAQAGFKTPPRPMLEWKEDGEPRILYGQGADGAGAYDRGHGGRRESEDDAILRALKRLTRRDGAGDSNKEESL